MLPYMHEDVKLLQTDHVNSPAGWHAWLQSPLSRDMRGCELGPVTEQDATSNADRVAYDSVTHFSREYRRLSDSPPIRDISLLRQAFNASRH